MLMVGSEFTPHRKEAVSEKSAIGYR